MPVTHPIVSAGLGTKLQQGDGATTEVFTTIAQRVTIEGPSTEIGKIDKTHLDSLAKEYRRSLPDPGELTLKLWYDPGHATHTLITTQIANNADTAHNFKLQFSDGTIYAFAGYWSKFAPTGMAVEENLGADVTLQLTGPITITPGP